MLQRFKDYIHEQHLIAEGDRVLLAVSGGRDSVCLTHLMHSAGIPFVIAHCNFNLRPGECDRDQQFVRELADHYGAEFHTISFDTRSYAAAHHLGIEEAARHLRYDWFADLVANLRTATSGRWLLATAHHRDDSVETFFLNLFRGTGISGLHGILPNSEFRIQNSEIRIIRPLLCFTRSEIDCYVAGNHLAYVEDSTNALLDARRNQLRHRLMPLLRELYPSIDDTMQSNIEHLRDTELVYRSYVDALRAELIKPLPSQVPGVKQEAVTLEALRRLTPQRTLIFELMRPYGFNVASVDSLIKALANPRTGSHFLSTTHEAVVDRARLVIAPVNKEASQTPSFSTHLSSFNSHLTIPDSPQTILLDADLPHMPLTMRRLRQGDRFHPFGMTGSRLLSDFLKDIKLNRIEKQSVWLLVDADDRIVWVVGLRADNRFRVTETTRTLLEVTLDPEEDFRP